MSVDRDHPKDRFQLDHIESQALAFEAAWRRQRLHHAWLLTGPQGLGKASFAYRAARRLLGSAANPSFGDLGSAPDDPISRLISSQAHPDLLVLERGGEGRKVIPVDEARRLPEFFAKAPALGGYRVAIIDAADDLNANGANAVLKTLEEPSARGVLFLVSHAPGRLLSTLRSRCRTLAFRAWPTQAVQEALQSKLQMDATDAARLAVMARGSLGRAERLAEGGALELDQAAQTVLEINERSNRAALAAIGDSFRGGEGQARFALFLDRLSAAVEERAKAEAPTRGARWAALWERVSTLPGRVEALNLDRTDAFWSVVADVGSTALL